MKVLCHPIIRVAKYEATLEPTCMGGLVLVAGSQMDVGAVIGAGRVLDGPSSGISKGWLAFQGLFRPRGVGEWGGACCCMVGHPLGKKQSAVIFQRTTISSFGPLVLASEESIDSTTTCLTAWASSRGSSTRMCSARPWKTISVDPSLTGSNESTLICRGPRLQTSPSVSPSGKNSRWRTSRYDIRGLQQSTLV